MGRVVGRTRIQEGVGTQMRLSETAIFIALAIAIVLGARWYFFVYRKSPGVALGQFVGAIKAGNPQQQYEMLDDADKRYWSTEKDYQKSSQLAYGYTERIDSVSIGQAVPSPQNPDVVTIQATLTLRAPSQGKELYQVGEAQTATDTYVLHKDKDGVWKVWLSKSPPQHLLQITPNRPGDSF